MFRYLVISPHTHEECKKAFSEVVNAGYTARFDWGCTDGDHTGWVTLEAEGPKEALMVVPSFLRGKARAVKLAKINPKGELVG
ncbi:MAG TPA: hypothetical protein VI758_11025 [Bacteroidota bacterium]